VVPPQAGFNYSDMIFSDVFSWPPALVKYLEANAAFLDEAHLHYEPVADTLISESLLGYHCTRLTPHERQWIRENGMQLPSFEMTKFRVETIRQQGLITRADADRMVAENERLSDDSSDVLWFFFFRPGDDDPSFSENLFR
jgi:hypothetical protein